MVVKICGIKTLEEVKICNHLLPDYIGFVFAESKRKIDVNTAKILYNGINHRIMVVGVFRNQDIEEVIEICNSRVVDLIQLHGNETDEYIKELKKRTKLKVIKAYDDSSYADYRLLDSKDPGTGTRTIYNEIPTDKPTFLAGGIGLDNITDIMVLHPYGIDLSSGVEENGFKNYYKMERIINAVRNYGR